LNINKNIYIFEKWSPRDHNIYRLYLYIIFMYKEKGRRRRNFRQLLLSIVMATWRYWPQQTDHHILSSIDISNENGPPRWWLYNIKRVHLYHSRPDSSFFIYAFFFKQEAFKFPIICRNGIWKRSVIGKKKIWLLMGSAYLYLSTI